MSLRLVIIDMAREKTVPFVVETTLRKLGEHIRTARTRRNVSLKEMSERLGIHRTVLSDAEHGKPGTAVSVYVSMLWAMDLLSDVEMIAHPAKDAHGLALARSEERSRASASKELDNDF